MARKNRPYHHGDLRRALLLATLELVAERGASGVSMREVARIAGVSQTAPYRHFPDKLAMLAAASEEGFALFEERIAKIASLPSARAIEAFAGVYVTFAQEQPAYFRLMFGQGSAPKAATPSLQAAARKVFQSFLAIVRALISERGLRLDAHETSLAFWALAHGLATLALEGQTRFLGVTPSAAADVARASARAYTKALARS